MPMKLLIVIHHSFELWRAPGWFGQRLAEHFPELEVVQRDSYEGIDEHLRDAEIIFTISLRPEQLATTRKLRWIHAPTAAVHQFLFPELVDSDVILTNSTEVHGPVVAEHVIALIFALAKKIPQAAVLQQKHVWGKEDMWREGYCPREIAGSTLGLIGLGSIGRRVALMASALGMRVIAVAVGHDDAKLSAHARLDFGGRSRDVSRAHPLPQARGIEPRGEHFFAREGHRPPHDEQGLGIVFDAHERDLRACRPRVAALACRCFIRNTSSASSRASQNAR